MRKVTNHLEDTKGQLMNYSSIPEVKHRDDRTNKNRHQALI